MNKKGKIYVLKDPRTNEVRYVGQTKQSLKNRLVTHIYDSINYRFNAPKCNWIRKLLSLSLFPIQELLEEVEFKDLDKREIYWIQYYRNLLGDKILNLTDGGNNICLSIKEYQRIKQIKPVYIINRFTLERLEFNSTKAVAEFLKCNRQSIPKAIHIKGECKGYYVSYTPFDETWLPPISKKMYPVMLTNTKGKNFIFQSKNHAIRFTQGTYSQHKNGAISALNNHTLYRGYYWKYIKAPLAEEAVKKLGELLETPNKDNQQPS